MKENIDRFQHLYFLSDEEIKEGDWYYTPIKRSIERCINKILVIKDGENDIQQLKIIATTDSSLFTEIENQCDGCKANLPLRGNIHIDGQSMGMACSKRRYRDYLPKPSIGFINEFVACYNAKSPITHVMVEYDSIDWLKNADQLKVNPKDNTITIRKIKDNYTREEVIKLIEFAWATASAYGDDTNNADCNDWIEHNL